MELANLKVSEWYQVEYQHPTDLQDFYRGKGLIIRLNPPCYPVGIVEVLCEDGQFGYFEAKDLIGATPAPADLTSLLLKVARRL
jgi:hypothetical protein